MAAVKDCDREQPVSAETVVSKKSYSPSQCLHVFRIGRRFPHFPQLRSRNCLPHVEVPQSPPACLLLLNLSQKTICVFRTAPLFTSRLQFRSVIPSHCSQALALCLSTYSKWHKMTIGYKTRKICYLTSTIPEQTSTTEVVVSDLSRAMVYILAHIISSKLLVIKVGKVSRYHEGKQAPEDW